MKIFTTFLVFFSLSVVLAQTQTDKYRVSGKVTETNGVAVPYANVLAFSLPDSSLKDGAATNDLGEFTLDLVNGSYYLKVRFLSFEEKLVSNVVVKDAPLVVAPIVLIPTEAMLDAVEVTVDKPQMELKLDKRVFNVQQDMSNAGLNGAEILDNIPSISVDAEGNVSLRGSQNVRILINGKPSTLTGMSNTDVLRQIDGSMIESVEVITNPSARYDAEGEVGIINIILKKEMKTGFNGSVNARVGYPLGYGAGFNLNYRTKKVNYFVGYGYGLQRSPGQGYNYQVFDSPDTAYTYEQFSKHERGGVSHNMNGGIDFNISPRTSLTLSANLRYSKGDNWSNIEYLDYDSTGTLTQIVNRDETEADIGNSQEFNLNFRKTFAKPDRLLTFDAKRSYSIDNEISDLFEISSDALDPNIFQMTTNNESEDSWLFQTDYVHPFGKEGKFETGAKISLRTLHSDYLLEDSLNGAWITNTIFNNYLIYTENIYATYIMAGNKSGKFSYQGGLRAEYSDVTTNLVETNEINQRQYLKLFPSFHFSYELKNNSFLQLSYSRRISRPRHWWLTPFYTFRDSRNFESGNPNINPEYTGSYEFGHLKYWKKGSVLSSFYYRRTVDAMDRIVITDSTGITWRIPVNLGNTNAFGVEFSGSYELKKWWNLNGSFNFYRAISEGEYAGQIYNNDAYAWTSKITSRFTISRKFSMQTSFNYESPTRTNQGSAKAQYYWDGAASWDIFKGNGTLSFNARDILNSRKRRSIVESEYFYSENEFQWRSRQFTLSFVYRINQKKSRSDRSDFGDGDSGM